MAKSFWEKMQAIDRRIIFLFIATAVIIPLLIPLGLGVNVTSRVQSIYDEVEKLEKGSPVLIAADFNPSSAPELYPMLDSAVYQCFRRNLRVVVMTMWPGAPDMVLKALNDNAALFGMDFGMDYDEWKAWRREGDKFIPRKEKKDTPPDPKKRVKELIEKLRDREEDIRLYAMEALASTGEPAVKPLTEALKGEDAALRAGAARALGEIGSAKAAKPLIEALKSDDKKLRSSAAEALGKIGAPDTTEPLIEMLKDDDAEVRSAAARALGGIGASDATELLTQALKDKDRGPRRAAAEALGNLGAESAVSALEKIFKEEKGAPQIWSAYALVKIKNDKDALKSLMGALENKDPKIRSSAAEALGALERKDAVESLTRLLNDGDNAVRSSAAKALGRTESAEAVEPLMAALKDLDLSVRSSAVGALNVIGDKRAIEPLIESLKDKSWQVRHRASVALKRITGKIERRDYIFLGFKAGGPAVILSAGQDLKGSYEKVNGKPSADMPVLKGVNKLKDFKYGIALSAGAPGIEEWVIYGSEKYGFKLGAGCTGVMAAENFPYLNAQQINGLMAGLKGAAEYEKLVKKPGKGMALPLMDPQAVAHLVIIAFIVLGNIAYFTTRKSKKS